MVKGDEVIVTGTRQAKQWGNPEAQYYSVYWLTKQQPVIKLLDR